MNGPVEIARYLYRHQADMAAGLLEDAGIDVVVVGDDVGGMYPGVLGSIRVVVSPGDAERARKLLAELEEETGEE